MGKRRGVYQRRPAPAQPASTTDMPFDADYMASKLKGVIRKPGTAKKVSHKEPNRASGGHPDSMPKGGNTSSNKSGAYPGV